MTGLQPFEGGTAYSAATQQIIMAPPAAQSCRLRIIGSGMPDRSCGANAGASGNRFAVSGLCGVSNPEFVTPLVGRWSRRLSTRAPTSSLAGAFCLPVMDTGSSGWTIRAPGKNLCNRETGT